MYMVRMPVWVWFPHRAWRESKNHEISSGASGGVFVKVCTRENFLLYGMLDGQMQFLHLAPICENNEN